MKNVTVTLDEDVARWARVWAARHNTSVSRMLGELIREKMREEDQYGHAQESFLSASPVLLKEPGATYPRREELHDR